MRHRRSSVLCIASAWLPLLFAACTPAPAVVSEPAHTGASETAQILRGRQRVIQHGCGDCHGGGPNPAARGYLAGNMADTLPVLGQFRAWPRNITPDEETGLGRFSERQIFNALRYGLRPRSTPDVEITSHVPGQGNHPAAPDYLSPGMPWISLRNIPEEDLRAIAAYLKRAVRPVRNRVQDAETPPSGWAPLIAEANIGPRAAPFPTAAEHLATPERRAEVLRGRQVVVEHACALCHGGGLPDRAGWLAGIGAAPPSLVATFAVEFPIPLPGGPFRTRPRNLTPDNMTGMGRFTERQIFNALRYGLRPGETPDVDITSTTPGQGNFPAHPKYLALPMPWFAWRHMPDEDLRAIAAYLKNGLKPVRNLVPDSEGPPDFWAGFYVPENIGTHPAPAFPTANERAP